MELIYQAGASAPKNVFLLDFKRGDVNGDGIPDSVYLTGHKPDGAGGVFADNITLVIRDGRSNMEAAVPLPDNAGYDARLFLGDFQEDRIADILVSIESGGSGGYGIFYIYSFRNNILRQLFDYQSYNSQITFKVNYENMYKVGVGSPPLDVLFTIDISGRSSNYLSQFYDENGRLKSPVQGEVLALGALMPVVTDTKSAGYDLLALQRIIGTTNADTLGYVENLLSWDGAQFSSSRLSVSIIGTKLISLF
ncbi:hypothetical protein [Paenibacillus beijingensis]|uniref:Spore coat protein n=1 Tax=Paenibacillus beijingensis TaxID=1126833 RepID=A0A0D5NJ66_9BACL|nr:hypothetical protein [Paenibacillus beijingensis]AJY75125.1 spore coat protein [Paenibacillus beijingensis]